MRDPRWRVATRAYEHDVAGVNARRLADLSLLLGRGLATPGPLMSRHDVHILHHDALALGDRLEHPAPLPRVFAGQDQHGVALPYV
jgi:hypothetical protein